MRLIYTLLATCLIAVLTSPLVSAAQKYQYLLLSLDSQALISLIKIMEDGQHQTLKTIELDFTQHPDFKGLTGNIAAKNTQHEDDSLFIARRMSELMLEEQAKLTDEAGLTDPESHFSFLYAATGIEVMDGICQTPPAREVRAREATTRIAIEIAFSIHGIKLDSIRSCGAAALVMRTFREVDHKPYMALIKSTYDVVYLVDPDAHGIPEGWASMMNYTVPRDDGSNQDDEKKVLAGGIFSLGFMASARFFSNHIMASPAASCQADCNSLAHAATTASDFRKDLGTLLGKDEPALVEQYRGQKRNNDLGIKYLTLMTIHPDAHYVETAHEFMISRGAAPLAQHIISQLPRLREKLATSMASSEERQTPLVYVMGGYVYLYRHFPFLLDYMNGQAQQHGFRFVLLDEDALENFRGRAAVSKLKQLQDVVAN